MLWVTGDLQQSQYMPIGVYVNRVPEILSATVRLWTLGGQSGGGGGHFGLVPGWPHSLAIGLGEVAPSRRDSQRKRSPPPPPGVVRCRHFGQSSLALCMFRLMFACSSSSPIGTRSPGKSRPKNPDSFFRASVSRKNSPDEFDRPEFPRSTRDTWGGFFLPSPLRDTPARQPTSQQHGSNIPEPSS